MDLRSMSVRLGSQWRDPTKHTPTTFRRRWTPNKSVNCPRNPISRPAHLTCNTVTGRLPTSLRATTSHFPNSCSASPLDFGSSRFEVTVSPGAGEGFGRTSTRLHANDFSGTDGVRFLERVLGRGRVLRMQWRVTGGWSSGAAKGFVRANRADRKTTGLISRLGGRIVCRNISVGGLLDVSFSSDDRGNETEYRSIPFGVVIANCLKPSAKRPRSKCTPLTHAPSALQSRSTTSPPLPPLFLATSCSITSNSGTVSTVTAEKVPS